VGNRLGPSFSAAARAGEGLFGVGLGGEGPTAHDETLRPSEGCWERIKEEDGRAAGEDELL
jgi:hypothetical protein